MIALAVIALALFASLVSKRDRTQVNFFSAIIPAITGFLGTSGGQALLSAGTSILGGMMDNKSRRGDAWANSPQGIRANAEAAGFNPLTVMNSGRSFGAGYAPTMGTTISNGVAVAMDQYREGQKDKAIISQIELENSKLKQQIADQTLNPRQPGIFERERAKLSQATESRGQSKGTTLKSDGGPFLPTGFLAARDQSRANGDGVATGYSDKQVIPSVTIAGIPFYGSGNYSSGETWEEAVSDGPLSWFGGALAGADLFTHNLITRPSKWFGKKFADTMRLPEKPDRKKPTAEQRKQFMRQNFPTAYDNLGWAN